MLRLFKQNCTDRAGSIDVTYCFRRIRCLGCLLNCRLEHDDKVDGILYGLLH